MQTPIFTTTRDIKYGVYKIPCGKTPAGKYSISIQLNAGVPQSIGKIQLADDVYGKNGEFFDLSKAVTISKGDTITLFIETKAQHSYIVISVGAASTKETSSVTISLYPDAAATTTPSSPGASASPSTTVPDASASGSSVHVPDASLSGSTSTSDPSQSAPIPAGCIELKHLLQCSPDTYTNIKHDPNTAYFIV